MAFRQCLRVVSLACAFLMGFAAIGSAQVEASLAGIVADSSGAPLAGATVSAANEETAAVRKTNTDASGRYQLVDLPVGPYELRVAKNGFQTVVRRGVQMTVGRTATLDVTLAVSGVQEQVTVTGTVALVGATTTDVSGLVNEQQVKTLPLNGRSYDLLMTLNPGVVNFTWEKTGGIGISNSTTANMFSVSGNRPQQNLFLLNGVEFTGAAENNMTPGGASGQLIGIDAVREFNILRDTYGAEYGKKPGGQISIVTRSGTNEWHGSSFEFLRDNRFDAANYFDAGSAPPFNRSQFGASLGGPLEKNKTFVFANYEGFVQNLHQTSVAFVPDARARLDAAPIVKSMGLLNLWPVPPDGAPDFTVNGNGDGVAAVTSSPLQTIREHFGTLRVDRTLSSRNNTSVIYTIDDSKSNTATPFDPYGSDVLTLREQVLSLQDTHVFPSALNTLRLGFSRAGYFFTGEPTAGTPAANVPGFLAGLPVGAVVVGGSQASNPQAQLGLAGSNNGSNLSIGRNLFTLTDEVSLAKGSHELKIGAWLQPFQSNEVIALSQYGQLTFSGLPNFLAGTASFLYNPAPTPMRWRSTFGALYLEDVITPRSDLTLSFGFRDEFSNGLHEANGNAANYLLNANGNPTCSSQPATNICLPNVGESPFTVNRAKFLAQPRASAAWQPFGRRTVVRAGAGMYNDLQDALGYRLDQNAPANPVYTIGATSLANIFGAGGMPLQPAAPPPTSPLALLVPGGVQPDMYTPTLIEWSVRVERELVARTTLSVGYVGSRGYHELIGVDTNAPAPVSCPASPCPATFPTTVDPATGRPAFGVLAGQPVPAGTLFGPTTSRPNPLLANTWTWMSEGRSKYKALQIDVDHRFSEGLSVRGVYTLASAMDDGDSLNATAASNAVALLSNPYDPMADWGPATYDVRHAASINTIYALPFGHGRKFLSDSGRLTNALAGDWTINSIVTLQSGFPFTPQLSYNPSNNGDTRNPVRPFLNPAFTGPVVTGNPAQWFDPNAFIAQPGNSGFYGDVGRDTYRGPGLATWDLSAIKEARLGGSASLQFRVEVFNLLNRANFNTPNLIVAVLQASPNATIPETSPIAGQVTSTSTSSRQVQLGVKLLW